MTARNTICLWFEQDAQEAARFYASTFPRAPARRCGRVGGRRTAPRARARRESTGRTAVAAAAWGAQTRTI